MKLWIARDECGYSQLYEEKPIKKNGYFEHIPNTGGFVQEQSSDYRNRTISK